MFACIHARGPGALECAYEFSPLVEELGPGTAVFDIRGMNRMLGPPEAVARAIARRAADRKLEAGVAVAANPDAAVHAARGLPGVTVVRRAEDLAGLPVELLEPPPGILETLDLWGIRTFGQLAALPEPGVAQRMGAEGLRLRRLARGAGDRQLRPAHPAAVFEETLELEHPVALLEPLSFLLARLLSRVCDRLAERGLAAHELRLALKLEPAQSAGHRLTLRLPVPMRNPRAFLKLMQLELEAHPPPAPVAAVTIGAEPAPPRPHQEGLFAPLSPEPEKLELTLARIAALVGEASVGTPELEDTHRPGAFRMVKGLSRPSASPPPASPGPNRLAFRAWRPPVPARVSLAAGRPSAIAAQGVRGKISAAAGPWRTSGDWWDGSAWDRDEWDIEVSDGALYRIVLERGEWRVEGSYD
jgi:protein ImuB